jgi:hypothetical protein
VASDSSAPSVSPGEVARLRSEVSSLHGQVSRVNARLAAVEGALSMVEQVKRQVDQLQASFKDYRAQYERDQRVLLAYNELTVAERRWEQEFGRFEEARDLAASIIDVVASGHINQAVLLDVTERLAIRTPRYWIAHATVAIAAWLDDKPGQHEEALSFALALDPGKTALFMALMLRDHDRDQFLQQWLDHYLAGLTPESLPRHFQVVIDGVTGGALGGGAAPRLVQRMADWYNEAEARQDISDAAVAEWKQRLLSLVSRAPQRQFPQLEGCQEWKALAARQKVNCAIASATRHFPGRFEAGADVPAEARDSLAGLLRDLARSPDPAEEKDLRAIREAKAVTETRGDLPAARSLVAAEEAGRTGTLNLVSMVNRTAFPAQVDGELPPPTVQELLAIMMSSRLITTAADGLRDELPPVAAVTAVVGERGWECRLHCESEADRTRPALRIAAEEQAKKACDQIHKDLRRRQGVLERLKTWGCPSALVVALGLGGSVFTPLGHSDQWLMAPAFAIGATAILGLERLPKVVRRARDRAETEKRAVTSQIKQLATELAELWDQDLRTAAIHGPELAEYLGGLTEQSVIAATRPLRSVPLPRTREFPSWTPHPPSERLALDPPDDVPPVSA